MTAAALTPPPNLFGKRLLIGIALALLVSSLAWGIKVLISGAKAPSARQVARISLLPDTPPPPPPPKVEKPPEPKDSPKPAPRDEAPRPAEVPRPANEPIKMEGAAGDGPSAFAAGSVNKEYSGGAPQIGGATTAAAPAVDRAQERLYANSVRQQLRDAVERHLKAEVGEATAEFAIWLERDGRVARLQLVPSGDAQLDRDLQAALDQAARELRLPAPPAHITASTAMRFKLTLRALG